MSPDTVEIPFLGARAELVLEDGATAEYARTCVQHLHSLEDATVEQLCLASVRYRDTFLEMIGAEATPLASPRDVLSLIRPIMMIVPDAEGRSEPVVHFECDCEWEEEHGLEWVIRAGRVIYVGPFESVDPWGEPSAEDA